jgi:hypothetical protein
MIKRLINEKQLEVNEEIKKFQDKEEFTQEEINELVILIAKKLNIL